MALDRTKILESLRSLNLTQNKGFLFLGLLLAVFIVYAFLPDGKEKPSKTESQGSQEQVKLDNKEMVDLALQKEKTQNQPLVIPQPQERIIVDNSNKQQRAPAPRQSSVVNVEGRKPTSLEQVKAVWDVDYVPVQSSQFVGALVKRKEPPAIVAKEPEAPQVAEVERKSNSLGHILPGTEISAVLNTGMLAIEESAVPFVARVTSTKGPKGRLLSEYNGCLLYGTAKLNVKTQRAEATTTYLSCTDRFTNLDSVGIGEDRTYGFDGRYYERLTDRLAYEFVGNGFSTYFDARARGLVIEDAYTAGDSVGVTRNIVSPHEYAMWKGLAGAFQSAEDELKDISNRKVPVIAVDPGRRLSFVVSAPTVVRALYEND